MRLTQFEVKYVLLRRKKENKWNAYLIYLFSFVVCLYFFLHTTNKSGQRISYVNKNIFLIEVSLDTSHIFQCFFMAKFHTNLIVTTHWVMGSIIFRKQGKIKIINKSISLKELFSFKSKLFCVYELVFDGQNQDFIFWLGINMICYPLMCSEPP
jgi:hypothetical protein